MKGQGTMEFITIIAVILVVSIVTVVVVSWLPEFGRSIREKNSNDYWKGISEIGFKQFQFGAGEGDDSLVLENKKADPIVVKEIAFYKDGQLVSKCEMNGSTTLDVKLYAGEKKELKGIDCLEKLDSDYFEYDVRIKYEENGLLQTLEGKLPLIGRFVEGTLVLEISYSANPGSTSYDNGVSGNGYSGSVAAGGLNDSDVSGGGYSGTVNVW
jgi:hypothetical protein